MERAFEAGADDLVVLPQSPDQLALRDREGVARQPRRRRDRVERRDDHACSARRAARARRSRRRTSPLRWRSRAARRCSSTSTSSSATSALRSASSRTKTIYDLAIVGRQPRRRQDRELPRPAPLRSAGAARADAAGPGGRDHDGFLRDLFDVLRRSYDFVIVDTPPGVLARGDRGDRRVVAPLPRRHARRALAQGHEDRPRDARADGLLARRAITLVLNRADSSVGISMPDVVRAARTGAGRARRRATARSRARSRRRADLRSRSEVGGGRVVRGSRPALPGGRRRRRRRSVAERQAEPRGACSLRKAS